MEVWQIALAGVGHLIAVVAILVKVQQVHSDNLDKKFETMWEKIDQHKETMDNTFEAIRRESCMNYIKKELYDNDMKHLKEMFERVDKSNKEYFDLNFKQLKELISK